MTMLPAILTGRLVHTTCDSNYRWPERELKAFFSSIFPFLFVAVLEIRYSESSLNNRWFPVGKISKLRHDL